MEDVKYDYYFNRINALCSDYEDIFIFTEFLCPELERTINQILNDRGDYLEILEYVFKKLDVNRKAQFLCYVLSTELDIFSDWYLDILKIAKDDEDFVVSGRAKSIYNLYKEDFDKVEK